RGAVGTFGPGGPRNAASGPFGPSDVGFEPPHLAPPSPDGAVVPINVAGRLIEVHVTDQLVGTRRGSPGAGRPDRTARTLRSLRARRSDRGALAVVENDVFVRRPSS